MAKGQKFKDEFKEQTAKRMWDGESPQTVAEELGIHYTTALDWKSKFKPKRKVKRRVAVQQPKENTRVSDERIRELEIERDIWKAAYMSVVRNRD